MDRADLLDFPGSYSGSLATVRMRVLEARMRAISGDAPGVIAALHDAVELANALTLAMRNTERILADEEEGICR